MRFTRYTLVGLAATAMHYALLVALMVLPDMPAALAAGVGALFGALFSYAGNRSLTFDCDLPHAVALPRFLTVAALGVALNAAIVGAATALFHLHYLIPQLAATALVFALGYLGNHLWSFR